MDFKEIGFQVWIGFIWLRETKDRDWWWPLVNTVMNLQVL
jgi:hypothetical protein